MTEPMVNWRIAVASGLLDQAVTEPRLRDAAVKAFITVLRESPSVPEFDADRILAWESRLREEGSPLHQDWLASILFRASHFPPDALGERLDAATAYPELVAMLMTWPGFSRLPGARDWCVGLLTHRGTAVVRLAIERLVTYWPDAVRDHAPVIAAHASSRNRTVRVIVARAVPHMPVEIAEPLLDTLLTDPERTVRHAGLIAAADVLGPRVWPHVALALRDPAPLVRIEATRIAGRLNAPGVAEALLERFRDAHPKVRREAVRTLYDLDADLAMRHMDVSIAAAGGVADDASGWMRKAAASKAAETDSDDDESEGDADDADEDVRQLDQVARWYSDDDARRAASLRVWYGLLLGQASIAGQVRPDSVAKEMPPAAEIRQMLGPRVAQFAYQLRDLLNMRLPEPAATAIEELVAIASTSGPDALAAQAFYIGVLTGYTPGASRLPAPFYAIELVQRADAMDDAFMVLSDLHQNAPDEALDNDDDDAVLRRVVFRLESAQRDWCLARATPRCLGWLLRIGVGMWDRVERTAGLSSRSREILKLRRKRDSTKTLLKRLASTMTDKSGVAEPAYVELLAGYGDRVALSLLDRRQPDLFRAWDTTREGLDRSRS
jgi:hypothetical protein